MKVKFDVYERLTIEGFLPAQAGFTEAVLIVDLRKKLDLSQDEIKEYEVVSTSKDGGGAFLQWNKKKEKDKEVELTNAEVALLKARIKDLEEDKKITTTESFINLCSKINELKEK